MNEYQAWALYSKPHFNQAFSNKTNRHTFKGSLIRHIIVENTLILIAKPTSLRLVKNNTLYKLLRLPFCIFWGLNCNFSFNEIMRYVVFYWFKVTRFNEKACEAQTW
jgi:hypothetical protein